jgi:hypothetical protein
MRANDFPIPEKLVATSSKCYTQMLISEASRVIRWPDRSPCTSQTLKEEQGQVYVEDLKVLLLAA